MSPTRRDLLKTIAALGAVAVLPAVPAVAASEPPKPAHEFDSEAIRFDARELLDAYCPEHLFSDRFERSEIRLTDVLDENKSITIGSTFASTFASTYACQYRLMVALASLGDD